MVSTTLKSSLILFGLALLTACGGGDSKEEYPTGDRYREERPGLTEATAVATQRGREGVFIDSPVAGLSYTSGGLSGKTDSHGRFQYQPEESIAFAYGSINFGSAAAQPILTPQELSTDQNTIVNQLRLLQTLDVDGDPSNGILLPDADLVPADLQINFAQSPDQFSADASVLALLSATSNVTQLVTVEAAQAHFSQSLIDYKSIAR